MSENETQNWYPVTIVFRATKEEEENAVAWCLKNKETPPSSQAELHMCLRTFYYWCGMGENVRAELREEHHQLFLEAKEILGTIQK